MEGSDANSFSLSSLLCQEGDSCLKENEGTDLKLNSCSASESDDEFIQLLIGRETTTFRSNSYVESSIDFSENSKNWLKCARLDAIKWILNTRTIFGFHFRTAYLSLTYFDRFLSRRSIDNGKLWAIRLLSIACLSLAAKMEECKVPTLSQYHVDEFNFESNVIHKMELLVLNTLEWKMESMTPFAYLHYFICKFCDHSSPKELVLSRAIDLILTVFKEIDLMDHRPSVIAAAAVLVAYDDRLTRKSLESKISVIGSWGPLEKEIKMKKTNTPKSVISPNLMPNHLSSAGVLDKSSIISAVGSKRKLTYSDCEQHCPLLKIPPPL